RAPRRPQPSNLMLSIMRTRHGEAVDVVLAGTASAEVARGRANGDQGLQPPVSPLQIPDARRPCDHSVDVPPPPLFPEEAYRIQVLPSGPEAPQVRPNEARRLQVLGA